VKGGTIMSKYEHIMENGCEEDYRHSLLTEGDMTYAEDDCNDE
jgi:hypothetical protein